MFDGRVHVGAQGRRDRAGPLKPLLLLRDVCKSYQVGGRRLRVLQDINLCLHAGAIIAIVGPSGSGKSTLLNIIGCLARPSSGSYRVGQHDTAHLGSDAMARLRRRHFGFVFQQGHLLPRLTALANVELPAIYAHIAQAERQDRAMALLSQLELSERIDHYPHQLSGGQQQRVAIARAMINGPDVILADEPTGALDSATGRATMRSLLALQRQGRSVILVTHDPEVAAHAERIIEVRDGRIVSDAANPRRRVHLPTACAGLRPGGQGKARSSRLSRVREVLSMARNALVAHRLRTLLTMLGIAIGSAAVVSIMAVGEGSRRHMQRTIGAFTSNLIELHRGAGWNDAQSTGIRSLLPDDVGAVQAQSYVQAVTPLTQVSLDVRHANVDTQALVSGVGVGFFNVRGIGIAQGRPFRSEDLDRQSQVAVIDQEARRKLFDPNEDPLGQVIFIGNVPCIVIGVTSAGSQALYSGPGPNILLPHTTAGVRLLGRTYFDSIVVRTVVGRDGRLAERGLTRLLTYKHGAKDFFVNNMDSLARAYERTTRSVSLMLSLVAAIALMVGGVGVMNIMLVSVTERTREIGVRLAAGARRRDITRQFLAEAVAICLAGGVGGVLIAVAAARVFSLFVKDWQMVFTAGSFAIAFGCALLIGLVFGLVPARKAAALDPGDALNRG